MYSHSRTEHLEEMLASISVFLQLGCYVNALYFTALCLLHSLFKTSVALTKSKGRILY